MFRRLLHALAALFTGQGLVTVSQVVLVPVFLTAWTSAEYGEWLALTSLTSYLITFDLGMNAAVINQLTASYARGDLVEYRRYQHTASAFYAAVVVAGTLLLAGAVSVVPVTDWLGIVVTPPPVARLVLWISGTAVLFTLWTGLVTNVFRTIGRLAVTQWIRNSERLLILVVSLLVLLGGGRMRTQAVAQLAVALAVTAATVVAIRLRHPGLTPGVSGADRGTLPALIAPGLYFLLIAVGVSLIEAGPLVLISAVLGGVGVALYATTRTIANVVRQAMAMLSIALQPEIAALNARENWIALRVVHRSLVLGATTLSAAAAAVLWFEGAEILRFWTAGRLTPDPALLRALLAYVLVQAPWWASGALLTSTNLHTSLATRYAVSSAVGVAAGAVALPWIGSIAFPLALTVSELACCFAHVVGRSCQVSRDDPRAFAAFALPRGAAVIAVSFTGAFAMHRLMPDGPVRWAVSLLVVTSLALAVFWRFVLSADQRVTLRARVRGAAATSSG